MAAEDVAATLGELATGTPVGRRVELRNVGRTPGAHAGVSRTWAT